MALRAVIMAGGAGTRLRPLTLDLPKPLAPLCGEAVMGYALRLLNRYGVNEATATLWYRPEKVKNAFGGEARGVRLRYITEETPLGTAGGVKRALKGVLQPGDTALVLSGDGLTALDIAAFQRFHRARGALCTLALKRVSVPLAYGVVVTSPDGRIRRFIEKPGWQSVESTLVNTGSYLLEAEALSRVPDGAPFDFGKQLFPALLQSGAPLYGYETDAYWCDVGDPAAFLRAQGDLLGGRAGFTLLAPGRTGAGISADSYVSPDAAIDASARIEGACVLPGARIGAGADVTRAIVCENALVGRGAVLEAGAVLGAGAALGEHARLMRGARLWPGITLAGGAVCDERVQSALAAARVKQAWGESGSPAQTARLAGAFMRALGIKTVAVMHDGHSEGAYHTLLGALSACGAQKVYTLGRGTRGMLMRAAAASDADGALCAQESGVWMLDQRGLPLSEAQLGAVDALARAKEAGAGGQARVLTPLGGVREGYIAELAALFPAGKGLSAAVVCKDRVLRALAHGVMRRCGHTPDARADIVIQLEESAARPLINGRAPGAEACDLLCARALRDRFQVSYDCFDLRALSADLTPPDASEACLMQRRLMLDGVARLMLLLGLFETQTPGQALSALPQAHRACRAVACADADKARVLEALRASPVPSTEAGEARAQADAVLPLLRVSALAQSAEYADELCAALEKRVEDALKNAKPPTA